MGSTRQAISTAPIAKSLILSNVLSSGASVPSIATGNHDASILSRCFFEKNCTFFLHDATFFLLVYACTGEPVSIPEIDAAPMSGGEVVSDACGSGAFSGASSSAFSAVFCRFDSDCSG